MNQSQTSQVWNHLLWSKKSTDSKHGSYKHLFKLHHKFKQIKKCVFYLKEANSWASANISWKKHIQSYWFYTPKITSNCRFHHQRKFRKPLWNARASATILPNTLIVMVYTNKMPKIQGLDQWPRRWFQSSHRRI